MDAPHDTETIDDLSALAWVHDELRRSLEAAHKSMRRYVKEAAALAGSDVDAVDPGVLRGARAQLHQGVGALELVGLPFAAKVLRASEAALQKCSGRPVTLDAAAETTIEQASFALLDYLARLLAGRAVSPLSLFPQYRAVQELAGADRVHPADLWPHDWQWREVPLDAGAAPRVADAALRSEVESLTLAQMRQPDGLAAARLSDLFAGLAAGSANVAVQGAERQLVTLWQMASAFFEAQSQALLRSDIYSKRIASRLLAQLRMSERAQAGQGGEVSQRLAQDLLFYCAQADSPGDGRRSPRLSAVRRAWTLARRAPVDYLTAQLGRFDPSWIAQAKKRVAAAKESWAAVAGGETHRLGVLGEQFQLVGESLKRLYPSGDKLADALNQVMTQTVAAGTAPAPTLAMEVATAMLYLEASLDDAEFDHPSQAVRVRRLAQRVEHVQAGAAPETLEAWMEDLYRRVSDRQTMGSVVQELRGALTEAEKAIDGFFRDPAVRESLRAVPGQLNAMRGVFSVLGLEQASRAVVRMRDDVEALSAPEAAAPSAQVTNRLASNLGALGFLIDMLSVQPAMVKTLFEFDAEAGLLRSVVGGGRNRASGFGALDALTSAMPVEPRLIEQAQALAAAAHAEVPVADMSRELERLSQEAMVADQPVLAETMHQVKGALEQARSDAERRAVREDLAQALTDFVHTSSEAGALDELPRKAARAPLSSAPTPTGQTGLEQDDEMREIFLEEAREVIDSAGQALAALASASDDVGQLTAVRRAFHTLKGSARMVGLGAFGEAAWAGEQLYNRWLAKSQPAEPALLALSADVLAYLHDWVEAIASVRDGGHDVAAVQGAIDQFESRGEHLALRLPGAPLGLLGTELPRDPGAHPQAASVASAAVLTMPQVSAPMPLREMMPELPRAQDLDLGSRSVASEPIAAFLGGDADEVDFTLDLGAAADLPVTGVSTAQTLVLPEVDADAPAPDAVSALMSLLLPESPAPAMVAEPASAPVAPEPSLSPPAPEPESEVAVAPEPEPETIKMIGPLRVSIALFNIFLNEADEQSRHLCTEMAEGALELHRPVTETAIALAHSLAGNSATVGFTDLSQLARLFEHALARSRAEGPREATEAALFVDAAEEIRRLLHQFAAGLLKAPRPELVACLGEYERRSVERVQAPPPSTQVRDGGDDAPHREAALRSEGRPDDDDLDAIDTLDDELFPIFEEEAEELLPQLAARLRDWAAQPGDAAGSAACMRTLHTLKGGARLAGAMRLGELAHRLESAIERLAAQEPGATAAAVEALFSHVDRLGATFDALCGRARQPEGLAAAVTNEVPVPAPASVPVPSVAAVAPDHGASTETLRVTDRQAAPLVSLPPIDWQRWAAQAPAGAAQVARGGEPQGAGNDTLRVRAQLLDRLVNHAGEVGIARARIDNEIAQLKGSLGDLSENLERLRHQLREIELQGETQISSRVEAAKAEGAVFDPLEMDRFTRFQELTRMMAESVNDVATVQRNLQRSLQRAEDELAAQAHLTRDLQDDLLRTRMVEFEAQSERLYRVVRQAAQALHKQVRLDIVGGQVEVDRGVLERMGGAFEHLLRNCVTHGIEMPAARLAAGKDATGQITVTVAHEGNEVAVEFRDDGGGLDLARIRERGLALGLISAQDALDDGELAQLIFAPGFSTAASVTELAGRGVGMDVVRAEVNALGGRIETASQAGRGTSFRLVLPLTTAVTQVVMLRAGTVVVAVPATLVETVLRATSAEVAQAYASASYRQADQTLPFFWLGALLQTSGRSDATPTRMPHLVVIKSAQQRIVLHVDEVLGAQEVVVKNLGAQLARLPGLVGVTLLVSGAPALIYNPVALATLYGEAARAAMRESAALPRQFVADQAPVVPVMHEAPLVLVVDDSLTVRRVTQRLLVREGYRVALAKDGLDALEKLAEERPTVVLSDIEMPRMDGFDLVRNLRADPRLRSLPVIMITSRIAQKHRDHAVELGVDHYLGKPYAEEDLLALVARYAAAAQALS